MDISLDEGFYEDSWVSFVSREFRFVQLMRLGELIEEQRKYQEGVIKSQQGALVK